MQIQNQSPLRIKDFNPNEPGNPEENGIFGLPFLVSDPETRVVLMPVSWDVTTSYRDGTANGPKAIFDASYQVDLADRNYPDAWKTGIAMLKIDISRRSISNDYRRKTERYLKAYVKGDTSQGTKDLLKEINAACATMVDDVELEASQLLEAGKIIGLIGGDHSTPLGLIRALAKKHPEGFSILHIDAHLDLRNAYEGFQYSHASIMYNAMMLDEVKLLFSVGIRDYCEEELSLLNLSDACHVYYDEDLAVSKSEGNSWSKIVRGISGDINRLGTGKVYLSFDIDGLMQKYCPNTGTPVPGGLEYEEALQLIRAVAEKCEIIGFDVNEVAPDSNGDNEWDATVGARLLYKIATIVGQQKIGRDKKVKK